MNRTDGYPTRYRRVIQRGAIAVDKDVVLFRHDPDIRNVRNAINKKNYRTQYF